MANSIDVPQYKWGSEISTRALHVLDRGVADYFDDEQVEQVRQWVDSILIDCDDIDIEQYNEDDPFPVFIESKTIGLMFPHENTYFAEPTN